MDTTPAPAYPRAIVLLFMAFLLVPGLLAVILPEAHTSASEKRRLAPMPQLEWSRQSFAAFPGEFEKYFRDHFGLRDQFVILYNTAFFGLFKASPRPTVIYGRDGWLYLSAMGVLPDFMGQGGAGQHSRRLGQILADRQKWLESLGSSYLYVPVPNKMEVYPEYLPPRYRRFAGDTLYSRLVDDLSQHRGTVPFIDLLTVFREGKKTEQLYYRTDTHWNEAGAYLGYRQIIDRLQTHFPEIRPITPEQIAMSDVVYPGDLALQFHLEDRFREPARQFSLRNGQDAWQLKRREDLERQHGMPGEILLAEAPTGQHTAVIIQDSFGNHLRKYFTGHFRRTFFITGASFTKAVPLIEALRPDVVIDLHVARNIPQAVTPHPRITAHAAREEFQSLPTALLALTGEDIAMLQATNARIEKGDASTALLAGNDDPQLLAELPLTVAGGGGVLRIKLESPAATTLQVFYGRGPEKGFVERDSLTWPLARGTNDIFLRLPESAVFDRLRIDPGKKAGRYTLLRLELRR